MALRIQGTYRYRPWKRSGSSCQNDCCEWSWCDCCKRSDSLPRRLTSTRPTSPPTFPCTSNPQHQPLQVRSQFDRQCISKRHWTYLQGQAKPTMLFQPHLHPREKAPNNRRFSYSPYFILDINTTHSTCLAGSDLMSEPLYNNAIAKVVGWDWMYKSVIPFLNCISIIKLLLFDVSIL